MAAPGERFFSELAVHELGIGRAEEYVPVPAADWWLALSDVRGSTQAIREGRYRDVNFVGASSAVALLNLARELEMPCVFGGDGVTLLLPARLVDRARESLAAVRAMARAEFGLELRCGLVPLARVNDPGSPLRARRVRISGKFSQVFFAGSAISRAVRLLKEDPGYAVPESATGQADYSGLECRWNSVRPPEGGVHLLLLAPSETAPLPEQLATLEECLAQVTRIYGDHDQRHPMRGDRHSVSLNPLNPLREAKLVPGGPLGRVLAWFKILARSWIGRVCMTLDLNAFGVDWGEYHRETRLQSDCVKMDDLFRLVLSGEPGKLARLREWLEMQRQAGRLNYGTHASPSAILTCLVMDRQGRHYHFVDGSDGGYALAALELKGQLKDEAQRS